MEFDFTQAVLVSFGVTVFPEWTFSDQPSPASAIKDTDCFKAGDNNTINLIGNVDVC